MTTHHRPSDHPEPGAVPGRSGDPGDDARDHMRDNERGNGGEEAPSENHAYRMGRGENRTSSQYPTHTASSDSSSPSVPDGENSAAAQSPRRISAFAQRNQRSGDNPRPPRRISVYRGDDDTITTLPRTRYATDSHTGINTAVHPDASMALLAEVLDTPPAPRPPRRADQSTPQADTPAPREGDPLVDTLTDLPPVAPTSTPTDKASPEDFSADDAAGAPATATTTHPRSSATSQPTATGGVGSANKSTATSTTTGATTATATSSSTDPAPPANHIQPFESLSDRAIRWWQTRPGKIFTIVICAVIALGATWSARALVRPAEVVENSPREILLETAKNRQAKIEKDERINQQYQNRISQIERELLDQIDDNLLATLEQLSMVSGSSAVTGPGLSITVTDREANENGEIPDGGRVQDSDLQLVVNALWTAGAEGIAINGQRLTATSSIRTAGSTILVNLVAVTNPYVIEAVGSPDALAEQIRTGITAEQISSLERGYGISFRSRKHDAVEIPGRSPGSLQFAEPMPQPDSNDEPSPEQSEEENDGNND